MAVQAVKSHIIFIFSASILAACSNGSATGDDNGDMSDAGNAHHFNDTGTDDQDSGPGSPDGGFVSPEGGVTYHLDAGIITYGDASSGTDSGSGTLIDGGLHVLDGGTSFGECTFTRGETTTETLCGAATTEGLCNASSSTHGCSWDEVCSAVSGRNCVGMTSETDCETVDGCGWTEISYTTGICTGTPTADCTTLAADECEAQVCILSEECTAPVCTDYSKKSTCNAQAGCTWDGLAVGF